MTWFALQRANQVTKDWFHWTSQVHIGSNFFLYVASMPAGTLGGGGLLHHAPVSPLRLTTNKRHRFRSNQTPQSRTQITTFNFPAYSARLRISLQLLLNQPTSPGGRESSRAAVLDRRGPAFPCELKGGVGFKLAPSSGS